LLIGHQLLIRLSTEFIFQVNDRCIVVLFVTCYGFIWQEYLLRDSIVLDVAVCFANSFLTSDRKLRHVTYKICNYWFSECTVLRFIHMESTNMLWHGKNYYHMKHSSVLVGTLDHGHVPPPFSRQCNLDMRGFQIELQNKLSLCIIFVLCHK
jgi:hypothetical protein